MGQTTARPARPTLAVIETHPIQYRAPVYRTLQERYRIPVTVIYGSDFSVAGYFDTEFRSEFAWDSDLLSGYDSVFLSKVREDGPRSFETVSARGMGKAIRCLNAGAILLSGYSPRFHQWAWWHAMNSHCPLLFRGETSTTPQSSGTLSRRARSYLLQTVYRKCSKILYIGQRSRDHFLSLGCTGEADLLALLRGPCTVSD